MLNLHTIFYTLKNNSFSKYKLLFLLPLISLSLTFAGCGSGLRRNLGLSNNSELLFQERIRRPIEQAWAVWLVDDEPLGVALEGDKHYLRGEFRQAFDLYRESFAKVSESSDQYKILLRLVGATYALGKPSRGLAELGDYVRRLGKDAEEVVKSDSIMFGYGYLLTGDKNQALSWFLKVIREGVNPSNSTDSALVGMAEEGVYRVIGNSNPQEIAEFQKLWPENPVIASAVRDVRPIAVAGAIKTKIEDLGGSSHEVNEIVAILPLSGKFAPLGQSLKNSITLAFTNWPDFKLTVIDSEGNAEIASSKLSEILRERAIGGILGPLLSDSADAISSMVKDLNIPMIHFAKRDILTEARGLNTYRLGVTPNTQALSMVKAIKSLPAGGRRIALLDLGGEVDEELARGLENALAQEGMNIYLRERYSNKNTKDLVRIAKEIESSDIDTLVFASGPDEATQLLTSISQSVLKDLTLVGGASWYRPERLQRYTRILDGAVLISLFNKFSTRQEVQDFLKNYKSSYGSEPDFLAAQAYDATQLLLGKLIPEAQTPQNNDYVKPQTVLGITGELIVRPYGEIERYYEALRLKDGRLVNYPEQNSVEN
jgi:ABC-type branched-subunit amino acid transport system substrate-binding protein